MKLVHHFQFIVHLDATLHQVQFAVFKVTEMKLEDLHFLRVGQDLGLWTEVNIHTTFVMALCESSPEQKTQSFIKTRWARNKVVKHTVITKGHI